MANFLIVTIPQLAHINPVIPISRTLVERGHQVVWMTGRAFKDKVEKTGAVLHPYPAAFDPGNTSFYEFWPEGGKLKGYAQAKWWIKNVFLNSAPFLVEAIQGLINNSRIDVLVGDTVTYGVYYTSELTKVPSAMVSLLPMMIVSRDAPLPGLGILPGKNGLIKALYRALHFVIVHTIARNVRDHANKVRHQLGLPSQKSPVMEDHYHIPSLVMQISTPAFEYPRSDQPSHLHFVGPILPEHFPDFLPPAWWPDLSGDSPVILVNQGTVANNLQDLVIPAIEAFKDEDVLLVTVPVSENALQKVPKNVRTEKFIPFNELLPHVDVMVTNGGYGGTQLALAHGVPLVVSGATEDKMEVAARVQWSGAGINLRKKQPSPSEIKNAVNKVFSNPTYRENAQRIQRDFAQYDAPKRAAELLELLAAGKGEFARRGA